MSSFGAGGGSGSGSTGGNQATKSQLGGLGLDAITKQFAQQLGQQQYQQPVQPGQMLQMSPQQRLAQTMRLYGGGA